MTNPNLLQKVLTLAKLVYPNADVKLMDQEIGVNIASQFDEKLNVWCTDYDTSVRNKGFFYQPHLPTERGRAQLMDLVFRLAEKSKELGSRFCLSPSGYGESYWAGIEQPYKSSGIGDEGFDEILHSKNAETLAEAIITLAIEVLKEVE